MRILGFSKKWDKLRKLQFTTFRLPRKDKDWVLGEIVRIIYKPRSKEREILGSAEIISKESRRLYQLTHSEAVEDGFRGVLNMSEWLLEAHGKRLFDEGLNKLTLRWVGEIPDGTT